jgi:predicted amidophosphoribosyltransferase
MPHAPDPSPSHFPPTWVAGRYEGELRAAIVAYKERGRRDLARLLGSALGHAVLRLEAAAATASLLLVPVPSRARVARRRGGDHVRRLAAHAAVWLTAATDTTVGVAPVLRLATQPRDTAGLTAEERAANLRGAFVARPAVRLEAGSALVLVDDVVTTGQTLAEAARALKAGGVSPAGGAAVAATPRHHASWRGS